jgi:hypothetical protein
MATIKKTDQDIKMDIARELAWDTRVAPTSDQLSVEAKA